MSEIVRLVLAIICFVIGFICISISIFGVFRFHYVLNRMQSAAIIDTLGLLFLLLGLILISWDMGGFPKLALILAFQWVGSPIASHMVGRMEVRTDRSLSEHMEIKDERTDETEEEKV